MNRLLISVDKFCRERAIDAIALYLAASLILSLSVYVTPKMSGFIVVCFLMILGPASYLVQLMHGTYSSHVIVIAFYASGYLASSAISVVFLRMSLRQEEDGKSRLFFAIVGILSWTFSGLFSVYPNSWITT